MEAKSLYPTYYRTDTHWNCFGAFIGYQRLMQAIALRLPNVPQARLADFEITQFECPGMDLARMLDSLVTLSDSCIHLRPHASFTATQVQQATDGGARECHQATNPTAPLERALVLHDSFFLSVGPFFNEHWRQVDYYWMYEFPHDAIERVRPQVVVQEMVERCLMIYEPCNPAELRSP
jgi:hypothetical protein